MKSIIFFPRRRIVALAVQLLVSGCVVGPNFKAPAPPTVSGYTAKPTQTGEAIGTLSPDQEALFKDFLIWMKQKEKR